MSRLYYLPIKGSPQKLNKKLMVQPYLCPEISPVPLNEMDLEPTVSKIKYKVININIVLFRLV